MSAATRTRAPKLSAYESEQVRRIAAWKSEPPNPLNELWKRVSLPVAREVERLIPDAIVRAAIIKAYDVSELLAGQEAIKRRAGVRDLAELKHKPLEECDALAAGVERSAEALAAGRRGRHRRRRRHHDLARHPAPVRALAGDDPQDRALLRISAGAVTRTGTSSSAC